MKFNQLANLRETLTKIANQSLPFTTAYRINRLVHGLDEAWTFFTESMNTLIQQYGQKDNEGNLVYAEDGQSILLIPETAAEANNKMMELSQVDANLPDITFTPEEFSKLELTAWEVEVLMEFIKE
jgi:hypothetical protein